MSLDDDIGYSGPDRSFKPDPGGYGNNFVDRQLPGSNTTYADKQSLYTKLKMLIEQVSRFINRIEEDDLSHFALPITDQQIDWDLRKAQEVQWPEKLGSAKSYVSYRYYKALKPVDTAAAKYIRKRFEEAIRDVTGTPSIDILVLLELILQEAQSLQEFLTKYVGQVDDSSEYRIVELFQEWTDAASLHVTVLQELYSTRYSTAEISTEEIQSLSSDEAQQSQAILKVKLNSLNGELLSTVSLLQKNFSDYSSLFFEKFLGPALQFRLNVGRRVYPLYNSDFAADISNTSDSLNANLTVMISDQLRRNKFFDDKISEIIGIIHQRDRYRKYINALGAIGKEIARGLPGTTVETSEAPEDIEGYDSLLKEFLTKKDPDPSVGSNRFESSHQDLGGRTSDDAHPQYLLLSGGKLTGSIQLGSGVKVGGIVPATHAHTGADGSARINGRDIIPGTVNPDLVDSSNRPQAPSNLRVTSTATRVVPPGVTRFDVKLAWNIDDPTLSFEVRYAAVES